VFEDEDFGSNITPETKAREARVRAEIANQKGR
jgi:hypothetical protein